MADVRMWFCWITAHDDRTEHAVSDDAHETSRAAGPGVFTALLRCAGARSRGRHAA